MKKIFLGILLWMSASQAYSQCACCAGAGIGSSNGDYNNGILTLSKNRWVAETYADYRSIQNGNAAEEDEKLLKSMYITTLGLRYGLTNQITVSVLQPFVFLHTGFGNDKGLGDMALMGTFSVFAKNNINIAVQAGIELPTGVQKSSNFDNTTVVVGSGSYDPMIGLSFSKNWSKLLLQASGLYKYTSNGFQNNNYGSLSVQNISLSYRVLGENAVCSVDSAKNSFGIGVFGGYYGEWLDKLKEDGIFDQNSGHYLGFATLGANFSIRKWVFPLTVSLPLINQVNGEQNKAGYRLRFGIIKSF